MQLSSFFAPHLHSDPTIGSGIWLLQLRWVAVVGQIVTIFTARYLVGVPLPVPELVGLLGVTAITNLAFGLTLRRWIQRGLGESDPLPTVNGIASLMLLDLLLLTGMLYYSGGPLNPFLFFYFVNVAIGGMVLTPQWAWGIVVAAIASVLWLLEYHLEVPELSGDWGSSNPFWSVRRTGFFVAFSTCCLVITYFIRVLTGELKRREKQLREAEELRARGRRLEALATLAAGAGHELATPLSTIAVVAKEMSRSFNKIQAPENLRNDLKLISDELQRCRAILDRMKSGAGEAAAERVASVSVQTLIDESIVGLREPHRVRLQIEKGFSDYQLRLPLQAVAQSLRNLLQNALDASRPNESIDLVVEKAKDHAWTIRVVDRGEGMNQETLQRLGEPFFTTKEPGKGMGLGVYLTHNVLNRLGGELTFSSKPEEGTTAIVRLPTETPY